VTSKFLVLHLQLMRFQVLTAATMKLKTFWDIAQCGLVEVDRRSEVHTASINRANLPHDRGSTHLWNVGWPKETTRRCIEEGCQLALHIFKFSSVNIFISRDGSSLVLKVFYTQTADRTRVVNYLWRTEEDLRGGENKKGVRRINKVKMSREET
jgi:hypothetical protein